MMGKLGEKPLRGAELGLSLLDPRILIAKATKGWGIDVYKRHRMFINVLVMFINAYLY